MKKGPLAFWLLLLLSLELWIVSGYGGNFEGPNLQGLALLKYLWVVSRAFAGNSFCFSYAACLK